MMLKILSCIILSGMILARPLPKQESKGMSVETFMKKVNKKDTLVLVDFNADWCVPCKKLKPIVDEIALEKKGKAQVLIIDVDDNPKIAEYFEINGLPVLMIYKNNKQVWHHEGFLDKMQILSKINLYQ